MKNTLKDPRNQNVQDPRRIWDHCGAIWGPDGFLKNRQSKMDPKWLQNGQFGLRQYYKEMTFTKPRDRCVRMLAKVASKDSLAMYDPLLT